MEVSDIIEAASLEEYVAQYIEGEYEERGGELWCRSPFRPEEKTPSFSIRPDTKKWYCFSTGQGGNILEFIMKYEGVSLRRSVDILKKFTGINDDGTWEVNHLSATKIARKFGHKSSKKESTAKPLPDNCMERYEFNRDKLKIWNDEGISWETMRYFGVMYDAFDDRIVYPIRSYDGEIISVCGRTCDPDFKAKRMRKYTYYGSLGTLDTICCFHENREDIMYKHEIILFEGFKSCAKARDWGVKNTGAVLTSHLSPGQLKFLIDLSCNHGVRIVFALDSDVDIRKDANINKLLPYANVEWVCNRDGMLDEKESPVDRGEEIFNNLYGRRMKL